jgi:hypothetical protein
MCKDAFIANCMGGTFRFHEGHSHNGQRCRIHFFFVDGCLHEPSSKCSPLLTTLRAMEWWSAYTGRSRCHVHVVLTPRGTLTFPGC